MPRQHERFRGLTFGIWLLAAALAWGANALAADFGGKGGPEPANIDELASLLHRDPHDLELLISFGTSKGGSAGHLALGIRDAGPGDDLVYSANFYADRTRKHESGFYTRDLMVGIPKKEYLFKTASSIDDDSLVWPRLRRNLQAIGRRRARLRCAGGREGCPEGLLQAHQ